MKKLIFLFFLIVSVTGLSQTASNLYLQGKEMENNRIFLYFDYSGDAYGNHTYTWYRADNTSGLNEVIISGDTLRCYTFTSDDVGKYIRASVIPADTNGVTGTIQYSPYTGPIAVFSSYDHPIDYGEIGLLSIPISTPSYGGTTYYVSPGGTGDGSSGNPWGNIDDAMSTVGPGDVVLVSAGTYMIDTTNFIRTETDGTISQPITIKAADLNNKPILQRTGDIAGDGYDETQGDYDFELIYLRNKYYIIDGIIFDGNINKQPSSYPALTSYRDDLVRQVYHSYFVVAITHYGYLYAHDNGEGTLIPYEQWLDDNGNYAIIRNCEVRNSRADGILVASDSVVIENTKIDQMLGGTISAQHDSHGVHVTHSRHTLIDHCEISRVTGDCLQSDNDESNDAHGQLWDDIVIQNTKLYTDTLTENMGDWNIGESPGENATDTKTFNDKTAMGWRPKIFLYNNEVYGWTVNGYIARRAAIHPKFDVDHIIDGLLIHDNQYAFRILGELGIYGNKSWGDPHTTITNVIAYNNGEADNGDSGVMRMENKPSHNYFYHNTFVDNIRIMRYANTVDGEAYDSATYSALNNIMYNIGESYTADFPDASNKAVSGTADFKDYANDDFHLAAGSSLILVVSRIQDVKLDIDGDTRPEVNVTPGADEYVGSPLIIIRHKGKTVVYKGKIVKY